MKNGKLSFIDWLLGPGAMILGVSVIFTAILCAIVLLPQKYVEYKSQKNKEQACECWRQVFTLEKKNKILRKQLKLLHDNLVDPCNTDDCQCLPIKKTSAKEI